MTRTMIRMLKSDTFDELQTTKRQVSNVEDQIQGFSKGSIALEQTNSRDRDTQIIQDKHRLMSDWSLTIAVETWKAHLESNLVS